MPSTSDAYVWVWLPGATDPVPAGLIQREGANYRFGYARSYLARPDSISLYEPELPLRDGWIEPPDGMRIAGALLDAGPDRWGREVIFHRRFNGQGNDKDRDDLNHLDYFLDSGSNRIGALDYQTAPTTYVPRSQSATLDDLHAAAIEMQEGRPLPPDIAEAFLHGSAIGGARPKVLLDDTNRHVIAKLEAGSDPFPVVKAEGAGIALARHVGIDVPNSEVISSLGRDVLLIDRFDRNPDGTRRLMISGLTMAQADENAGRYVTYPQILDVLNTLGSDSAVGRRLFERIVFNVAISNNDDHARNHAAFWDGKNLTLTPAYDLAPQARSGDTFDQAMAIDRNKTRASTFRACVDAAPVYGLDRRAATDIIEHQIATIEHHWDQVADQCRLTSAEKTALYRNQILHEAAFYGYESPRSRRTPDPEDDLTRVRSEALTDHQDRRARGAASKPRCGKIVKQTGDRCLLDPDHDGNCRSVL